MSLKARAAVIDRAGAPPVVEEVTVDDLQAGEVLIAVGATGVCHTDLTWTASPQGTYPVVPGHECAGTIVDVGPGVTRVKAGQKVVVSSTNHCGHCIACTRGEYVFCVERWHGRARLRRDSGPLISLFGIGGFAEYIVVSDRAVVPVPDGVPMAVAAMTGCAVVTGFGAALHLAGIEPGDTVAIFGAGAVGLSAVMGAAVMGAEQIVVVDPHRERRELALRVGATAAYTPDDDGITAACPAGFDVAFESAGRVEVMQAAVRAVRSNGVAVLMGVPGGDPVMGVDAFDLVVRQKRIVGCQMGSFKPAADFDTYFRLYLRGRLPLDALVTDIVPLTAVADAFDRARRGEGVRLMVSPEQPSGPRPA